MTKMGKLWIGLGCVLCLTAATASAAIIDDEFTGDAGSPPNPAIWSTAASVAPATVTLDGVGNVVFNNPGGYTVMEALGAYHAVPGVGEYGNMTMKSYVGNGATSVIGLMNASWTEHVLIRTERPAVGTWVVSVKTASSGGEQNYDLGVGSYGPNDWNIQWALDAVRVYCNGGLVFDSAVTAPGLIIPSVAMAPWFHALGYTDSMDRTTWDVVPEPATMSLLVLGGLVMLKRRR